MLRRGPRRPLHPVASIYGLVHLANPGAGALSAVMISAIGVTRIYGWLSTEQLWLSMGMHAGW